MVLNEHFDVAIIGGGPAGLSAALTLGRARKHVLVLDEGSPRNAVTGESHGFLTRDGIKPSEFRRIARDQIRAYPTVTFVDDIAVAIDGEDGRFRIKSGNGSIFATKKLLFASGMKDRPVPIPGLAEVYGKSAFVCPYCDGWELRNEQLVLICKGADAMHLAPLVSGWTNRIAVCTNGPDELTDEQREDLRRHGVPLFDSPISAIHSSEGMVRRITLEDGTVVPCTGIFFKPDLTAGSNLPQTIGCHVSETGMVIVDQFGKTNIPGVYGAGDAVTQLYQVIHAASMGASAAAFINHELNLEIWNAPVEER